MRNGNRDLGLTKAVSLVAGNRFATRDANVLGDLAHSINIISSGYKFIRIIYFKLFRLKYKIDINLKDGGELDRLYRLNFEINIRRICMLKLMKRYGLVALVGFMLLGLFAPMASGQSDSFVALKEEVEQIADSLDTGTISVYIETSEGTIAINETEVMSSASTIKVPILAEALKQAEQGDLFWDDEVVVEESDVVGGSGVIKDMDLPQSFTVRELADLMITVSDNTATNMLMERVGFDEVNWACIEMGCVDTVLQTSIYTSMPQDRGPHNYSNTKDMVTILKGVNEGGFLTPAGKEEFLRIMRDANEARLSEYKDPERHKDILVGRKGGSTASPRVLHDVGIFTLGDEDIYAAVFTKDVQPNTATPTIGEIGRSIMDYMVETN